MTTDNINKFKVLIVGGGIGGLMLGVMLERAGMDYEILERSPEHRPLGSAITLNGTVLRLFEQLGMLDDLYKVSKFAGGLHLVKEDMETQGHIDLEHFRESIVLGRPDLFKVLAAHIPPGKLHMSKRVLSTAQTDFGVVIRCSDGSSFQGDILVGADGAYSSVRQCMHKSLKEKGMLPRSDSEKLKFDQHCVVGITNELSPEKFPVLKEEFSQIYGIIGKKRPYTLWLIPIVGNRFAWSIGGRILDSEAGQEDVRSFSFAEWWPEHSADICNLVRDYSLPSFISPYQHDEHYKSSSNLPNPHDEQHFSDIGSMSDACSFRSVAPSDVSPVNSSCSSIYADNRTIKSSRSSIRSKWKLSVIFSPLTDSSASSKQGDIFSPGNNASTSSISSEHPHGFMPKRKTPPAKPGTVAEIIDATSPDRISKVMLESKMFKVWHHERTVLLGDACHKILPFAGQGAIQAILDGISLANALYDMESNSLEEITKAFKRYSSERIPLSKVAVTGSRSFGKLVNIQGKLSDFIRKVSFRTVPNWLMRLATDKLHLHRPQLAYLPMVPDRGSAKAHGQYYSPKYVEQCVRNSVSISRRPSVATVTDVPALQTAESVKAESVRAESIRSIEKAQVHDDREEGRRERRNSIKMHARFQPSMLAHLESKGKSVRSLVPPPLPLEAPPRHHPDVTVPILPEDVMAQIPLHSRSNSIHSSPTSSSYSLLPTGDESRPQLPHSYTRGRRHTTNGRSRSISSYTSRSTNQDSYQPPVPPLPPKLISLPILPVTFPHSIPSKPFDGQNTNHFNAFSGFTSQLYTPPRSPLSATPPVNFNDLEITPITCPPTPPSPSPTQYKRTHKRTKSLQLDPALASSLLALGQPPTAVKGRSALREHRSLDQMHTLQKQQRHRH
ncbi:hypothetical protein BGZ79_002941 [Entomortierella chlamydospora]|nr:hypothetical protein BGZ79_002941 [Entomortierella chlamydospora]